MRCSLTVIIIGLFVSGQSVAQDLPVDGPPQLNFELDKPAKPKQKTEAEILLDERLAKKVTALDYPSEPLDYSAGPPEALAARLDPCRQFDSSEAPWIDRQQVFVYRTVCGATAWFDGFFGNRRFDQTAGDTFGRISVGGNWDQLSGFDEQLRFRARFSLPSLRRKTSLLIGRGDEQDLIEGRDSADSNPLPTSAVQSEDDSTFIGLGFDGIQRLSRALNFSVGVKLSGFNPYVKARYRRVWQLTDRNLLRLRPVVYWRGDEGLGATMTIDVDRVLSNEFLLRWTNYGNISEDKEVEGVAWGSTVYLFQALPDWRAFTYSVFAGGETDAEVTLQNVGFEVRYRQRIYKEWLFIEAASGVNWPRQLLIDKREANLGIGLRFEAYFGPAPADWMK